MSDFDWVTARAKCSAIEMFMRLKVGVGEDVEARNQIAKGTGIQYGIVGGATSFTVYQEPPGKRVAISLNDLNSAIHIDYEFEQRRIVATLTLNNDRECRFLVNGEELEEWQLRRLALEKIFFG